jgi:hypothetical protein
MKQVTEEKDNSGWEQIDFLARGPRSFMTVGGDDKSDIKMLDGSNYQRAPRMIALLRSKELGNYVNSIIKHPYCMTPPAAPPVDETGMADPSLLATYKASMKEYEEQRAVQLVWDTADDKALGIMQLKIADKLQYLVKNTAWATWDNIKAQFDVSGPAAIFVDFKWVINFRFDEKKEPSVQVAELNTRLNRLATHGFGLDNRIQAMIILSGLPQSWDGVQGSILANHAMDRIDVATIMPVLQEEWSRRQARRGDYKSSHLARTTIREGPQCQQWQNGQNSYQNNYNPQAGPSNYNSGYKPAPYNKFSKKPNYVMVTFVSSCFHSMSLTQVT